MVKSQDVVDECCSYFCLIQALLRVYHKAEGVLMEEYLAGVSL